MNHNLTIAYRGLNDSLEGTIQITGTENLSGDAAIGANTTPVELDIALTRANIKGLVLYCDQDCLVKTNSSSSPQETITLTAGVPWVAFSTSTLGNTPALLLAGNITKFFAVNNGSPLTAGTFKVRAIIA